MKEHITHGIKTGFQKTTKTQNRIDFGIIRYDLLDLNRVFLLFISHFIHFFMFMDGAGCWRFQNVFIILCNSI